MTITMSETKPRGRSRKRPRPPDASPGDAADARAAPGGRPSRGRPSGAGPSRFRPSRGRPSGARPSGGPPSPSPPAADDPRWRSDPACAALAATLQGCVAAYRAELVRVRDRSNRALALGRTAPARRHGASAAAALRGVDEETRAALRALDAAGWAALHVAEAAQRMGTAPPARLATAARFALEGLLPYHEDALRNLENAAGVAGARESLRDRFEAAHASALEFAALCETPFDYAAATARNLRIAAAEAKNRV